MQAAVSSAYNTQLTFMLNSQRPPMSYMQVVTFEVFVALFWDIMHVDW